MVMSVVETPLALAQLPRAGSMFELKRDALAALIRAREEHGDVVRFSTGPPGLRAEVYCVFSAEGVQQVMAAEASNFRKDTVVYSEVRESFGNGLLTSQDSDYLRQRRLVQPLFTRRRVDGYAEEFIAEAASLVEAWRYAPDGVVDLAQEMSAFTLRTVGVILFGADMEAATSVIQRSYQYISQYAVGRGYSPVRIPRSWPTAANRRAAAAHKELYAVCDALIAKRAATGPIGEDLLSLLTSAGNAEDGTLDAGEIRDQVLIFILAGQETTATALAFTLHLLACYPEVQAQARAEVDRVLSHGRPSAADLDALPYLMTVFKEAMRLYPPGPVTARRAVKDTTIGGHTIPAGSDVIVAPWVTHRHPRYWDDPERFDPSRFTPENESSRPRYAWLPFGGGPRACIGQHFAMLNAMLPLAMLLQTYELEAVDTDVPVAGGITLTTLGSLRCRLTPRQTAEEPGLAPAPIGNGIHGH
jgi:cytochrome P450